MLTLQQLLESDSIATIVAKLNDNFQTLALTNGGPQGIRGPQGIPGLPGKLGPIGPTGLAGPTGTILGIIPFSAGGVTGPNIGPSVYSFPNIGTVGPWPYSSYKWLLKYYGNGLPGGLGSTPSAGDVFVDHGNSGYWKFLNAPDQNGASTGPNYDTGGAYSYAGLGTWPNLGPGAGYAGPGWYFYPTDTTTSGGGGSTNNVWVEDKTTYLIGNLSGGVGPYGGNNAYTQSSSPLTIANARLLSKYGTVWISSGNDQTSNADAANETPTIKDWGSGKGTVYSQPGRNNAGIDRLLFKMSIDGLPYKANVKARGYTGAMGVTGQFDGASDLDFPSKNNKTIDLFTNTYMFKPAYDVNISEFTPLLFFSERREVEPGAINGTYSTLGYYMYTNVATQAPSTAVTPPVNDPYGSSTTIPNNNVSKSLHLFSTRYAPDPTQTYQPSFNGINSKSTLNFGEFLLDFRKVVASNQYVCSVPSDLAITGDSRSAGATTYDPITGAFRNRVGQGYSSSINGRIITGLTGASDYWEYGLGSTNPSGAAGFHDTNSGVDGMVNRNVWYGTSVMQAPSTWVGASVTDTELFRVAGMMERGRKFTSTNTRTAGSTTSTRTHFLSELVFYTSQFKATGTVLGATAGSFGTGLQDNPHNSKPAFYVSPYGNIGVGTFVGNGDLDYGPLEPSARFHVHAKKRSGEFDPTWTYETFSPLGSINKFPSSVFGVAAFTGEKTTALDELAHAADVYFGFGNPSAQENITPNTGVVNDFGASRSSSGTRTKLRTALRAESWENYSLSSMRFGVSPFVTTQTIGRNGADLFGKEFILSLSPINAEATTASTSVSGVGIHNLFPRTRFHLFGKNINNEIVYGMETYLPSYASPATELLPTTTFPFYSNPNTASTKQISIDYIEDSYDYPVGIYEYQYQYFPSYNGTLFPTFPQVTVGTVVNPVSPNSATYPKRETGGVTRSMTYSLNPYYYTVPSLGNTDVNVLNNNQLNGSWRHGGTGNAQFEPSSYFGFNLIRDLSSATGTGITNTLGDNADSTRWLIGTQGTNGVNNHGNNGAAAFMFSPHGELGLVTIPRGNDGGIAYEQWEQRGLGTRDIINQMKIVFDKNGNIAIGNAAGWDLDAYPSLERNFASPVGFGFGSLSYVPKYVSSTNNATTQGPVTANPALGITAGYYFSTLGKYGNLSYTSNNANYVENANTSTASLINSLNTLPEYIRLEVAAEKAWSRNGRSLQRLGWGYPPNSTITITSLSVLKRYIAFPSSWVSGDLTGISWVLTTDAEGRLITSNLNRSTNFASSAVSDWKVVIYPHPVEFSAGGPLASQVSPAPPSLAPAGAVAAEWAGMNDGPGDLGIFTPSAGLIDITAQQISFVFAVDERGSANMRLNNFVYGEGYGSAANPFVFPSNPPAVLALPPYADSYTASKVILKRQQSPKFIFSFLEKTPTESRPNSGYLPYKKVNTVIMSAQNEASLREYWIPKSDNTGGTFMVFTDHLGSKIKDTISFNNSIPIITSSQSDKGGLRIEQVITQEFLGGYSYTSLSESITNQTLVPNITSVQNQSIGAPGAWSLDAYSGVNWPVGPTPNNQGKNRLFAPRNLFPGYVRYSNTSRISGNSLFYNKTFALGEYAKIRNVVSGTDIVNSAYNPYSFYIAQRNSNREADYTQMTLMSITPGAKYGSILQDTNVARYARKTWKANKLGTYGNYKHWASPYDGQIHEFMYFSMGDTMTNVATTGDVLGFSTSPDVTTWNPLLNYDGTDARNKPVYHEISIKLGRNNVFNRKGGRLTTGYPGLVYANGAAPITGYYLKFDFCRAFTQGNLFDQNSVEVLATINDPYKYRLVPNFVNLSTGMEEGALNKDVAREPYGWTVTDTDLVINFYWTGTVPNNNPGKSYFVRASWAYNGTIEPWAQPYDSNVNPPQSSFIATRVESYTINDSEDIFGPCENNIIDAHLRVDHFAWNVYDASSSNTQDQRYKYLPDGNFIKARIPNGYDGNNIQDTRINVNWDYYLTTVGNGLSQKNKTRFVITDDSQILPHYSNVTGSVASSAPLGGTSGSPYLTVWAAPRQKSKSSSITKRNESPSHIKITADVTLHTEVPHLDNFREQSRVKGYSYKNVPVIAFRWLPSQVVDEGALMNSTSANMYSPNMFFTKFMGTYTTPGGLTSQGGLGHWDAFRIKGPYISDLSSYIPVNRPTAETKTSRGNSDRIGWDFSKEIQFLHGVKSSVVAGWQDWFRFPEYWTYSRFSTSPYNINSYAEQIKIQLNSVVYQGKMEWLIPYDLWCGDTLGMSEFDNELGWTLCAMLINTREGDGLGIASGGGLYWDSFHPRDAANQSDGWAYWPGSDPMVKWDRDPYSFVSAKITNFNVKFEEIGLHAETGYATPKRRWEGFNPLPFYAWRSGYPAQTLKGSHATYYNPDLNNEKLYATVNRNIDYYYNIVGGIDENNWGGNTQNFKSAIRLRRINEDFAIIDYNITVEVQNPEITDGNTASNLGYNLPWCLKRIDFGGPRWTQYLRFIYTPDDDGFNDSQYNSYGTGWWLSNWSAYNQWYPGTAIVGPNRVNRSVYKPGDVLRNTTTDGSPFFSDPGITPIPNTDEIEARTWNGNMLDLLSSFGYRYRPDNVMVGESPLPNDDWKATIVINDNSVFRGNSVFSQLQDPFGFTTDGGGVLPQDNGNTSYVFDSNSYNSDSSAITNYTATNGSVTNSGVFSAFGADRRLIGLASRMFNAQWYILNWGTPPAGTVISPTQGVVTSVKEAAQQQAAFARFLGASYSLWGNLTYMRNKNTQWRLTPVRSYNTAIPASGTNVPQESNGFILEVQLSDPILHVNTAFGTNIFGEAEYYESQGSTYDVITVTPYKYLTVSGQAIVRFAKTSVNTNERPPTSNFN